MLCANVGITGPVGPVESVNVEDWDLTMSVNVRSAFLCCRRAIPLLREAGGGSILLTSSTAGITGLPMRSPYSASKHALIGLSDTLAMELGEFGIRVNTLCPGAVDGDRVRLQEIPGMVPSLIEQIPGCLFAPRCSYACLLYTSPSPRD